MSALIIGGHFSIDRVDSLRHRDDFRLTVDAVPMSVPNLIDYFRNGRTFPDDDVHRRLVDSQRRPYRQLYWSGLHLYDLLLRNGFEAALLNCHDLTDDGRLDYYRKQPAVVIISTTFMNMEAARKVAADVRQHLPDAWIVVGGSYARYSYLIHTRQSDPLYADRSVRENYFFTSDHPVTEIDCYVVDQHGENTLLSLLVAVVREGRRPVDIANTVVSEPNGWRINELRPETYDIEAQRLQWRQIPRRALSSVVPFQNTYGCPFKCGFCNFSLVKVHKKSIDTLFDELRELAKHNVVQKVWFTDDNFFLNEKLVTAFCERYIEEDLPFSWMSFIRASSITPETAKLIKRSRCDLLIMGFESGSQTVLDSMQKNDTVAHYRQAASELILNGVDLEMSFIIGYPGETGRTVDETIEFINSLPYNPEQISYLYLFLFNIVPLSPIFEKSQREQWNLEGSWANWRHNSMTSDEAFAHLRRIAASTPQMVFNYLDPHGALERKDMVELMHRRDDVARARISHGEASPVTSEAWDRLESLVRRLFPGSFVQ